MIFRSRIASAALVLAFGLVVTTATATAIADVVVVVASGSPITKLSNAQVIDIFLGKVSRFPDGTIAIPIDQANGSQAREDFYLRYAGKSSAQLLSYWAKIIFTGRGQPPKTLANSLEVKKLLAANPRAIGYIERSAVDSSVKVVGEL